MNKLVEEKSPYLKQHAGNPVDWHPWNDASLALAKKINKPIFLSIGYSTCHWCHVMAHESFENLKIAEVMNENFFNIKVDREERPDVDAVYMAAVQALTGSGGWPMSVWLTPDLKPFYAGTYFPPDDRYGRPGFPTVLSQLAEIWTGERSKITESANQITELLSQYAAQKTPVARTEPNPDHLRDNAFASIKAQFDAVHGGFSPAPKFPMPVYMDFLLDYHCRTKNQEALSMVSFTMENIIAGGITDQLGGGFARYSTDEKWIVPHFEKMLYDNAQLVAVLAGLFQATQESAWKDAADRALAYLLRDLRHAEGGFFSAEDADSEGKEGAFYLWTVHEVRQLLGADEAEAFIDHYGLTVQGNFLDPHTRDPGQNVLVRAKPSRTAALERAEKKLFEVRNRRPRPHRDEKIIAEWNGLTMSALAKAASAFNEPHYRDAAIHAAQFVRENLWQPKEKRLLRSWCDGQSNIEAQQSDYAMLAQGLLDLHALGGTSEWLDWASELHKIGEDLFFDDELGGYFMNVARPDLLIRMKDTTDNVIPSGNSIALKNAFRLSALGRPDVREKAVKTVRAFSARLESQPVSMASMLSTLEL